MDNKDQKIKELQEALKTLLRIRDIQHTRRYFPGYEVEVSKAWMNAERLAQE